MKQSHSLSQCEQFMSFNNPKRWGFVCKHKLSIVCLSDAHFSRFCSDQTNVQCQWGCQECHHRLLQAEDPVPVPAAEPLPEVPAEPMPAEPVPVLAKTPEDLMLAKVQVHRGVASLAAMGKSWPELLPAQEIKAANGASFMEMFDSGLQITFVMRKCAR